MVLHSNYAISLMSLICPVREKLMMNDSASGATRLRVTYFLNYTADVVIRNPGPVFSVMEVGNPRLLAKIVSLRIGADQFTNLHLKFTERGS